MLQIDTSGKSQRVTYCIDHEHVSWFINQGFITGSVIGELLCLIDQKFKSQTH